MDTRLATERDLPELIRIYNQSIANSTATFDTELQTAESRRAWFGKFDADDPLIVCEIDAVIAGYAYYCAYREKPAYAATKELSVYVDEAHSGRSVGSRLYESLIARAQERGVHVLVAVIAGENPHSVALHRKFGFERVGTLREVGRKFDAWVDTTFWQRILAPPALPANPPID